jgi:N-glycosidase YbiA
MSILSFDGNYRFLSNFFESYIRIGSYTYPTVEHAYQTQKTIDKSAQKQIRTAVSPSSAKKLGGKAPLRKDWEVVKLSVMEDCVRAKFMQNPHLAELLRNTGNQYIEEGNTWGDKYWGVCDGMGKNMLGKIIMKIRGEL